MSSSVAYLTSTLFETLVQPLEWVLSDTSTIGEVYEKVYSMPILTFLREHMAIISVTLYLMWYIKVYLSRTELIAKEGSFMHRMTDKFTCVHTGYRPTIWCFWSTMNTIVFAIIQRCIKHDYKREVLKTPDGGQIAIDWAYNESSADKKQVLLVLPGLTGSSKDNYVTHLVDEGVKKGCKCLVMNYRGIGVDLVTPRTYCATNYEDLDLVVSHVLKRFPDHKIFAIGVSLGGLKLGGYLAKCYDDCPISNAMIVSAPMNIFYSCEELEKTQYFFTFNRHLTRNCSRYFNRNKHLFEGDDRYDCKAIAQCASLRDFDDRFTSKQFNYASYEDYYRDACLDSKIQNIKTPTVFLNAADDMFSPERALPFDKIRQNPYTAMVCTKYGGHISFCEGLMPTGCNYSCRLLSEYLNYVMNEPEAEKIPPPAECMSDEPMDNKRPEFTL